MMFKAEFVIQSTELTLDELTAAMNHEPDSGRTKGTFSPMRRGPIPWSTWSINLTWPPDSHAGTDGLSRAVESLDYELARRAEELGRRGCDVVVSVLQELDGDQSSGGLHLTHAALSWMVAAAAALSVDQYCDSAISAD